MPTQEYRYAHRISDIHTEFTNNFSHRGELNGMSIVKRSHGYWWCKYFGNDHWMLQEIVRPGSTTDPVTSLRDMHLTQWVDEATRASRTIQERFNRIHGRCPDFQGEGSSR